MLPQNKKLYNEIYPPIIEKQKTIDPCDCSVYQLLEQYVEWEKDNPLAYNATAKAHAMVLQKIFFPMYLEHLAFVIVKAGYKNPFAFKIWTKTFQKNFYFNELKIKTKLSKYYRKRFL